MAGDDLLAINDQARIHTGEIPRFVYNLKLGADGNQHVGIRHLLHAIKRDLLRVKSLAAR